MMAGLGKQEGATLPTYGSHQLTQGGYTSPGNVPCGPATGLAKQHDRGEYQNENHADKVLQPSAAPARPNCLAIGQYAALYSAGQGRRRKPTDRGGPSYSKLSGKQPSVVKGKKNSSRTPQLPSLYQKPFSYLAPISESVPCQTNPVPTPRTRLGTSAKTNIQEGKQTKTSDEDEDSDLSNDSSGQQRKGMASSLDMAASNDVCDCSDVRMELDEKVQSDGAGALVRSPHPPQLAAAPAEVTTDNSPPDNDCYVIMTQIIYSVILLMCISGLGLRLYSSYSFWVRGSLKTNTRMGVPSKFEDTLNDVTVLSLFCWILHSLLCFAVLLKMRFLFDKPMKLQHLWSKLCHLHHYWLLVVLAACSICFDLVQYAIEKPPQSDLPHDRSPVMSPLKCSLWALEKVFELLVVCVVTFQSGVKQQCSLGIKIQFKLALLFFTLLNFACFIRTVLYMRLKLAPDNTPITHGEDTVARQLLYIFMVASTVFRLKMASFFSAKAFYPDKNPLHTVHEDVFRYRSFSRLSSCYYGNDSGFADMSCDEYLYIPVRYDPTSYSEIEDADDCRREKPCDMQVDLYSYE